MVAEHLIGGARNEYKSQGRAVTFRIEATTLFLPRITLQQKI
jgi:hypothetical protein